MNYQTKSFPKKNYFKTIVVFFFNGKAATGSNSGFYKKRAAYMCKGTIPSVVQLTL